MTVDLVTDAATFARLEPAWRALESSPGLLGLFNGYTWQFEWWKALGGRGRDLRVLVARDGGSVTGILPLYEESRDGARCLAFIGGPGGGSDYLDALCDGDATRQRLIDAAGALEPDLLDLEDLHSKSPLVPEIERLARERGGRVEVAPRYPCPFIIIEAGEYARRVPRRDTLARRQKWLAAQPGFRIECETSPESAPAFLDRLFRLHAARWSIDGGSQAFADSRLAGFHRSATARLAAEGRARMWTLWVAREAVAVAYSFEDRGRSLYYQSGFLPAWASRSAGGVLFARYVEDAFERGASEIDLLRGDEPYKSEWTRDRRATVSARLALTARGRAALLWRRSWAGVRGLVRGALPSRVRTGVARRLRQRRLRAAVGDA